jgi:hypothetical protein
VSDKNNEGKCLDSLNVGMTTSDQDFMR